MTRPPRTLAAGRAPLALLGIAAITPLTAIGAIGAIGAVTAVTAVTAIGTVAAAAGDWPGWMGPHGNGAADAEGVFPPDSRDNRGNRGKVELREAWRRPLGGGYSSISVANGRAYTLASNEWSEDLIALSAEDGAELWRTYLGPPDQPPSSTPTVDGERVFAVSASGILHAVRAASGETLWQRDLAGTMGARLPSHGMSSSPLVDGELVVVLVGGREAHNLVAFHTATGEVVWSVFHAALGSYSTPVVGVLAGERQIVVPGGDRLYAVRPEDGELLWSIDDLGYPDRNPLLLPGDRVFLPLEVEGIMLRVARGGGDGEDGGRLEVEELWRTESFQYSYSPVVHLDGVLYSFDDQTLASLDADSGETLWRHPLSGGSLILVDRHLLIIDGSGRLRAARAGPLGYEEVAIARPFGPGSATSTPPSFAAGRVYVRDGDEVVVVEVGAAAAPDPGPSEEIDDASADGPRSPPAGRGSESDPVANGY